jgi:preprotein translocase subunit SecB
MTQADTQNQVIFNIEKIYVKDSSYEAPNAPQVFRENRAPEVNVQLGVSHQPVSTDQGIYEVVLAVTVTAKAGESTVFLAETHQAGLFRIQGVPDSEISKALEIACPNVLLPFVRQSINDLVEAGGFPQLLINPINFEALYLQKQAGAPATH